MVFFKASNGVFRRAICSPHKLTMCLDKRHSVTGRLQSDLDIAGRTDRRCGDDKLDKRSEEFNCWALSGCLVNNGVTS